MKKFILRGAILGALIMIMMVCIMGFRRGLSPSVLIRLVAVAAAGGGLIGTVLWIIKPADLEIQSDEAEQPPTPDKAHV